MRILVTGANGYLGSGIVKELLDKGHDVIATDLSDDFIDKRSIIKLANLFEIVDPYLYFEKPDILLHCAWRDGFIHNSSKHIDDLPKHYSFILKMAKSKISKISILGSMHEIGFFEGSINEFTPTNPSTFYGISKNSLREITKIICQENFVEFQWLRAFYIVGNASNGSSIFSKIVQSEKEGRIKFPFTSGLNQFDFINYEDFCRIVALVITQSEINGIINVCSGRPEKLADRVERFIKENNFNIELEYGVFPERLYDSKAVWGDNTKILKILDLTKNKIGD